MLSSAPRFFAPGGKGNLILSEVKDAAVGDGAPVSIAPQMFNGIAEAVKGLLDVRTPVRCASGNG